MFVARSQERSPRAVSLPKNNQRDIFYSTNNRRDIILAVLLRACTLREVDLSRTAFQFRAKAYEVFRTAFQFRARAFQEMRRRNGGARNSSSARSIDPTVVDRRVPRFDNQCKHSNGTSHPIYPSNSHPTRSMDRASALGTSGPSTAGALELCPGTADAPCHHPSHMPT